MRSTQTEPSFNAPAVFKSNYAASSSITLPKLLENGDSVNVYMTGEGSSASFLLNAGGVVVASLGAVTAGANAMFRFTVIRISSTEYQIVGSGSSTSGINSVFVSTDTTNNYSTSNVIMSITGYQAVGLHAVSSV